MGGFGSGRTGGHPTSEGCGSYVLSAKVLKAIQSTAEGCKGFAPIRYDDGFEVNVHFDRTYPNDPHIELEHYSYDDAEELIRYSVNIIDSFPPYGGRRWWWVCPRTAATSYKLFLPNGGRRFLSRQAYRLGYACQRETDCDRLMRKARKLHRQLGGDGQAIGDNFDPPKPKWMRWKTYERKLEEWHNAEERADAAWFARASAIVGWPIETEVDLLRSVDS